MEIETCLVPLPPQLRGAIGGRVIQIALETYGNPARWDGGCRNVGQRAPACDGRLEKLDRLQQRGEAMRRRQDHGAQQGTKLGFDALDVVVHERPEKGAFIAVRARGQVGGNLVQAVGGQQGKGALLHLGQRRCGCQLIGGEEVEYLARPLDVLGSLQPVGVHLLLCPGFGIIADGFDDLHKAAEQMVMQTLGAIVQKAEQIQIDQPRPQLGQAGGAVKVHHAGVVPNRVRGQIQQRQDTLGGDGQRAHGRFPPALAPQRSGTQIAGHAAELRNGIVALVRFEECVEGGLFSVGQVIGKQVHQPRFFGRDGLANDLLLEIGIARQRDFRGGEVLQHDPQEIGDFGAEACGPQRNVKGGLPISGLAPSIAGQIENALALLLEGAVVRDAHRGEINGETMILTNPGQIWEDIRERSDAEQPGFGLEVAQEEDEKGLEGRIGPRRQQHRLGGSQGKIHAPFLVREDGTVIQRDPIGGIKQAQAFGGYRRSATHQDVLATEPLRSHGQRSTGVLLQYTKMTQNRHFALKRAILSATLSVTAAETTPAKVRKKRRKMCLPRKDRPDGPRLSHYGHAGSL